MEISAYDIAKFIAVHRDNLEPIYLSIEDFEKIRKNYADSILGLLSKYIYMIQDENYKNLFKAYIKMHIERDALIRYPDFDEVDDKYELLLKDHEGFNTFVIGYNKLLAEVAYVLKEMSSSEEAKP